MAGKKIYEDTKKVLENILSEIENIKGKTLLIGCSTSEVSGSKIGTSGNSDAAEQMGEVFFEYSEKYGFNLAFQCCEHLNRSLVIERELLEKKNLTEVNAIPVKRAGGAMAEEAYKRFKNPCLAESIEADLGIDIGFTLIGMNLKKVAVPVRLKEDKIGEAKVIFAKTRPKYVGGERAIYNSSLK
jgi:uncharacterized protein (TIGR01440 family)